MRLSPRGPARWLLYHALPRDEREFILQELDEVAARRFGGQGLGARLWYLRQTAVFAARFLNERRRELLDRSRQRQYDRDDPLGKREPAMTGLVRDISFALRLLAKQPGFAAVVVLTLALGIGPNSAIFSVVNGVLLRPLPYEEPEQLALIRIDLSGLQAHPGIARAEVLDFRHQAEALADVGAVTREFIANLTGGDRMEAGLGASVTPNLFPMLGIRPIVGRAFRPIEETADQPPVAIIGHGLWQRRFGGDPQIVGRETEINNRMVEIVGVLPEGFRLLLGPGTSLSPDVDVWFPLVLDPEDRGFWAYRAIVRMAPGVSIEQAEREVKAVGAGLVADNPDTYDSSGIAFYLHPLHNDLVQDVRPAILVLFGAVALVLMIACTNAASLLLARMKSRERELALRAALGAHRSRIIRQVLIESLVLAMAAGVFGLALGTYGLRGLLALQPGNLPRIDDIALDPTVLAFTLVASFAASLIFGLVPAWQASRPEMQGALKVGVQHQSGLRARTRGAMVVAQVAFCVMLLIGAGLLVRTFASLRGIDLGFSPDSVLTMRAAMNTQEFSDPEARWEVWRQFTARIAELPGVSEVGGISLVPLGNQGMIASYGVGDDLDTDWNGTSADYRFVLPGYFESMGMRLISGRAFDDGDNQQLTPVAIIDESLAAQAWPGEDPVGRQIAIGLGTALNDDESEESPRAEVVGVVTHIRGIDIRRQVRPQIYLPYRASPRSSMFLTVRASGEPASVAEGIRDQARALGLGRPVHTVRTMRSYVDAAMSGARFTLTLMATLAGIALLLSTIGVYSVVAYLVRQRTRETGIRLALGAERADIVRLNLREGMVMTAIGVPIGLVGALFFARSFEALLFGVAATDPYTFLGIPLLLLAVTAVASWLPARRATRVDPLVALRSE